MNDTYGFDIDGVLCNWYLGMCRKFNKSYKEVNMWDTEWLLECFEKTKGDKEFWLNLPVLTQPELLEGLNVKAYITSSPKEMINVRKEWLKKNGFPDAPVIYSESNKKHEVCKKLNISTFIEDKPRTIKKFKQEKSETCIIQFIPEYAVWEEVKGVLRTKTIFDINMKLWT